MSNVKLVMFWMLAFTESIIVACSTFEGANRLFSAVQETEMYACASDGFQESEVIDNTTFAFPVFFT